MNARTRLFEEPPEWLDETWRHGALLGGMAGPTGYFEMAKAFRLCADTIVDQNGEKFEAYEVVYPLLYLYRHALELSFKAILGPQGTHPLDALMKHVEQRVNERLGVKLPSECSSFIHELHDFDPRSFSFRYGEQHQPGKRGLPGEYWVEFSRLKKRMGWMFDGLERIYHAIGPAA